MNTSRLIASVVASSAVLVAAPTAMAAQTYSLKADKITGESVIKGQEGTIDLNSFDFGIEAETSFLKGTGAAVGKPNPGALTLTKRVDSTSPAFMAKIVSGTNIAAMELTVRQAGPAGAPAVVSRYCFTSVFVTGQKYTGNGDSSTEELKFVYKQVGQSQAKLNAPTTPSVFAGWDVSTMQLLSGSMGTSLCTI